VGFAAMVPFITTTFYVGPVAEAMNGADLSFAVGLAVSAGLYWALARNLDVAAEARAIEESDRRLAELDATPARGPEPPAP